MKAFRSTLGALAVAGAATATGFFGFNYIQSTQFARAADQVGATREQLARMDDLSSVFRHVGKVVEPSVVNISVTKTMKTGDARGRLRIPEHLRRQLPDLDGDGAPDLPDFDGGSAPFEQHGTGSGVIMEVENGTAYVLTNNHVAGDATAMEITLSDGRKFTNAKVVGADKKTDLAVIRFEADRIIPAKWGDSDELQKGDWIMAFGSPFGYVGSMTHGIVSALNRQAGILGSQGYENFIQVDAPINPGNSGGPLVNTRGEVVGINTAIASRTGSFSGIGFAIPSNQAKFVYESIKAKGKVVRGWLGVSISDVSRDIPKAQSFGYQGTTGVLVEQVMPNTPAVGKLQPGDIVTSINGKGVGNVQALRHQIAATAPNVDVKLNVFRDGKEQEVVLRLGEQPDTVKLAGLPGKIEGNPDVDTSDKLGLKYADPSPTLLKQWDLADVKEGAVVTSVDRSSAAGKAGLSAGDVITRIGGKAVRNADDLTEALKTVDLKRGVRMYVTTKDPESGQTASRFIFVRDDR
ncbi:MAG TPA: trypsin-like peptidase domain-containing protein [Tepidisphaeraceae bacterium]|nr:trypsin-like peptidase domain-containing protein [Tepidisphaeraceae bacterium]